MQPTPLRTLPSRWAILAATVLALPLPASPQPPTADRFSEKVQVREVELVVELPDNLSPKKIAALTPESFLVTEDGTLRPVTKAEPLADAPWTQIVYVDQPLASADTVAVAGIALANRTADLTRLGTVEVVVADPQPRIVLPATRDGERIKKALLDLAAAAHRSPEKTPAKEPDAATVRRESDRLVTFLAERAKAGPRSLFLVADAFELPAEKAAAAAPKGAATTPADAAAQEPFLATGGVLAAYGWVTVALPMRGKDLGIEHRELSDLQRLREGSGTRQTPNLMLSPTPKSTLNYDGVINVFVLPRSAWLHSLATDTAGTLVGYEEQLKPAFDGLGRRWHVFYQAPDPADGRLRPIEVKLLPQDTPLRAPRFRRSSTPEALAAAWARGLLAGQPNPGDLPLTVAAKRQEGAAMPTLEITVAVDAYSPPGAAPAGPYRLTVAWAGAGDAVTVRHSFLSGKDLSEKGFTRTVDLEIPAGSRRLALLVEDLGHQTVGGRTLDVPGVPTSP
ncbi:MAG TPA: hypothetical protein VGE98_07475 [Thermoanaerobaculia bacterium]